jgi:hypothetical protein
MGKIKSTLELAMERTRKFTLSEKEKEEMRQKEVLRKATSLFHRYREKHLSSNEILREIGRMEKNTSTTVKELLLSQWIEALSLDDDDEDERILKGVESLMERSIAEIKQRFHHLLSQYQTEKEKVREQMTVQWIEALRMEGIYGSAVDPNLEGSDRWKKESERLDQSYRMKLEAIKQQWRVL